MKKILILSLIAFTFGLQAQNVGIGTNTPLDYAKLDISSTTAGLQLPRMTTSQRSTLASNISALSAVLSSQYSGMIVYDATLNTMYMWDATKSTNGDWVNILDTDASVDDADADATNEIQDLSLTGNVLSLTDDATTVDLSVLKDHDWYESTGTTQADNIGDNIYTNGSVAIGTTNYNEKLTVFPDANESAEIGRAHVGYMGHNDWAGISHIDRNTQNDYALIQNSSGQTLINSSAGQEIQFKQDNASQIRIESDGDLRMEGDNSIKMPNNIRWIENRGDASYNNNDNWRSGTYTATMNVESGNVLKLDVTSLLRLTGGSGDDDFYIRVHIDGTGGCSDSYSEELGWIRHNEGGSDHDNFRTYSYMDVVPVSCNGTMRFRLEIKNTGDDNWQRRDAILVTTKF